MTGRRLLLLALPALLSACSASQSPQAACAAQAENAPEVRRIRIIGLGGDNYRVSSQELLAQAKKEATIACLQRRGLAPPGGVEAVRPSMGP